MESLNFTTNIRQDEIVRLLSPLVEREVAARIESLVDRAVQIKLAPLVSEAIGARARDHEAALSELSDRIRERIRQIQQEEDGLAEKMIAVKGRIEAQLESLEKGVTKKANTFLIPAATVVLLLGFLALWAVVGSSVWAANTAVRTAFTELDKLTAQFPQKQAQLKSAGTDIDRLSGDILGLSGRIADLKSSTGIAELMQQVKSLNDRVEKLTPKASVSGARPSPKANTTPSTVKKNGNSKP